MEIVFVILTSALIAYLLFKPFFGCIDGFIDCVKFWFTPDIISVLRDQYYEDIWGTFKLWIWAFFSFGSGYVVYAHFT